MNLVVDSTPLAGFVRSFFFAAGMSAKHAEYLRPSEGFPPITGRVF